MSDLLAAGACLLLRSSYVARMSPPVGAPTAQGDERQNRTANSPESINESSPQYPLYERPTRSSWEEHDDGSDGDTNVDETQSSTLDRRDKVHRTLSDLEPLTLRSDVIGIKEIKSFSPTTLQTDPRRVRAM